MAEKIVYTPQNVCSREMYITVEDNRVVSFSSIGGCNGNLQGIGALVEGMDIDEVISKLSGIKCRGSRTREDSCPNQLATALKQYKESKGK